MARHDVAVVGAGIVGLATARELLIRRPDLRVVVVDAADRVGSGQTSHNSGVIHAGVYYAPGSLKARLCVEGARAHVRLLRRARHRRPALRQGRSSRATRASWGASTTSRRAAAPTACRACGGWARRSSPRSSPTPPASRRCTRRRRGSSTSAPSRARLAADVVARGGELTLGRAVRGVDGGAGEVRLRHADGDATAARHALFCAGARASAPGGRGGRRGRPADRPLPRPVPAAAPRRAPPRPRPDLPGARPGAAVPRRAPDPPRRRAPCGWGRPRCWSAGCAGRAPGA